MRNKTLLIATLVLGLVAFAVVRLTRETAETAAAQPPLVDPAVFGALKSLTVKSGPRSVTVVKTGETWTVSERFGLPADVENRLLPLIRGLQKARQHGQLTANPKRLEKLGLTESSVTLATTAWATPPASPVRPSRSAPTSARTSKATPPRGST